MEGEASMTTMVLRKDILNLIPASLQSMHAIWTMCRWNGARLHNRLKHTYNNKIEHTDSIELPWMVLQLGLSFLNPMLTSDTQWSVSIHKKRPHCYWYLNKLLCKYWRLNLLYLASYDIVYIVQFALMPNANNRTYVDSAPAKQQRLIYLFNQFVESIQYIQYQLFENKWVSSFFVLFFFLAPFDMIEFAVCWTIPTRICLSSMINKQSNIIHYTNDWSRLCCTIEWAHSILCKCAYVMIK